VGRFRPAGAKLHAWVVYRNGSGEAFLLDPSTQRRIWKIGRTLGFYKPLVAFGDSYPEGKKIARSISASA
jgi:hypothetical protein